MPQKSVREMSRLEQLHYSLSAKTFHAIWMISLILTGTAILMEVVFYRKVVSGLIENSEPLRESAHLYLGLYIGVLVVVTFLIGLFMAVVGGRGLLRYAKKQKEAAAEAMKEQEKKEEEPMRKMSISERASLAGRLDDEKPEDPKESE